MTQQRGQWGTRLGFIMAAAGSAVGLGNIWKFPYMTGENGGGAFLVIYMVCIVVFGFSLVMAELVLGRMAQKTPVAAFREIAGRRWSPVGGLAVLTAFVIDSFYVVVAGWTLAYIGFEASGASRKTAGSYWMMAKLCVGWTKRTLAGTSTDAANVT